MLRCCAMKKSYVSKQQQNKSEMTESLTLPYKMYTVCDMGGGDQLIKSFGYKCVFVRIFTCIVFTHISGPCGSSNPAM